LEGSYQISNFGRVKSLEREAKNRNGTHTVREKILIPSVGTTGYLLVVMRTRGKSKPIHIHRLGVEL